jgi:two-component system chemotaxis response regulator CheB
VQATTRSNDQARRDIVVIGASAGGVQALRSLAGQLPPDFPACVCIVQHIGEHPTLLPSLMSTRGPNPVGYAVDGAPLQAGLVVAPPDRHLLIDGDRLRLSAGAKEHHTRPAIDPLFRSAAISAGPRVVGVVLTGCLDDGSAGLQAIRDCGGVTVVQDPADAEHPSMPRSALQLLGTVDHVAPLARLGALLTRLAAEPAPSARPPPGRWVQEQRATGRGPGAFEALQAIGRPTALVCPECQGGLFQIQGDGPPRYRCHTGHAFSLRSMGEAQARATEDALYAAMRALQDKAVVLRQLAELDRLAGDAKRAAQEQAGADEAEAQANALLRLVEARVADPPPTEPVSRPSA